MADKMIQEKRRVPRVLVRVLVDFESAETFLYDYSNDLSEGGIYLETAKPLPIGSPLTLRFTLPNVDHVFEVKAKVAWLNDGKAQHLAPGMGVQFLEVEPEEKKMIQDYVKEIVSKNPKA